MTPESHRITPTGWRSVSAAVEFCRHNGVRYAHMGRMCSAEILLWKGVVNGQFIKNFTDVELCDFMRQSLEWVRRQ